MKTLLGIEWLKIKRYPAFWVLAGLFLLLLPLWNYEVANGFLRVGVSKNGLQGPNLLSSAYSFPQVWGNLGFWGSVFITFITILVIIITTNEYAFRTNRQNVIDGWSRMQFFHAKISLVILLSVAATLYIFVLGIIFGKAYSGSLSGLFSEFQQVGYFFLLSVDYLGFGLFIALWIRKSGLAIGLFLLYSLIIENILKASINHYSDLPYGNLLPLQASDELLPFPLLGIAKAIIAGGPAISMNAYAIVAVFWCAVYYFGGRALLTKSDW